MRLREIETVVVMREADWYVLTLALALLLSSQAINRLHRSGTSS